MTKQLFYAICVLLRGVGKLASKGAAKPNVSPLHSGMSTNMVTYSDIFYVHHKFSGEN